MNINSWGNRGPARYSYAVSVAGGFTLIELLVVIAIIGILSSIVLNSLNTSRSKGNDAKVRSQLLGLRSAAEIYYDNNTGYTASTMASPAIPCTGTMFIDAASKMLSYTGTASAWPTGTTLSCQATATGYAVSASLSTNNPSTADNWCVDSTGISMATANAQASGDVTCL